MNRLVFLGATAECISEHLQRSAPLEDGCFCLVHEAQGVLGRRFLVTEALLPSVDGWEAQERDQLRPSGQWLSAVIGRAIEAEAGLLFLHSHPDAAYPVGFSPTDRSASLSLGTTISPMLDGTFLVAVVHPDGWVAAIPENGRLRSIDRVAAVGRTLRLLDPAPSGHDAHQHGDDSLDGRQRDALGVVHERLRALHVGIVGAGGLGSPMAEQVVRMGVAGVTLIDDDRLDTKSNVRRVFGSTGADLHPAEPPAKVDVVGRHLDRLLLNVPVRRVKGDVRCEDVYRELLDTDVVLCGTDTHGSRAVVNDLASTYLLPVIDVGVRAGAKTGGRLAALPAEIRVLTPETPCLWCRQAISGDVIRAENLPPDQHERLAAEGYLPGWSGAPAPSVIALTVLGAGLATCALLALLSDEGDVCPSGYIVDGFLGYAQETEPTEPVLGCRCRRNRGRGDVVSPLFRSAHQATHRTMPATATYHWKEWAPSRAAKPVLTVTKNVLAVSRRADVRSAISTAREYSSK